MNPIRSSLLWASRSQRLTRAVSEGGSFSRAARRFIAGETEDQAVAVARVLNQADMAANLDLLGENTASKSEATAATDAYVALAKRIHAERLNAAISVKLTQLGMDLGDALVLANAERLVEAAHTLGVAVEIDMEASPYVDRTLSVYRAIQERFGGVAIAVQAYLHRTVEDVRSLVEIGAKVRVVKGAYKEPRSIAYQSRFEVREAFRAALDVLMTRDAARRGVITAVGSHDDVLLDYAEARVREHQLDRSAYEYQFLYGIRRDLQDRLVRQGEPVRLYVPFGTHWYPYFMRRLAERPANLKFFVRALAGR